MELLIFTLILVHLAAIDAIVVAIAIKAFHKEKPTPQPKPTDVELQMLEAYKEALKRQQEGFRNIMNFDGGINKTGAKGGGAR